MKKYVNIDETREMAEKLAAENPGKRLAYCSLTGSIGVWHDKTGKYYPSVARLITGEWVHMPYDILVNGQPVHREWIPLTNTGKVIHETESF